MKKQSITADHIKELLAQKHSNDVFVSECKTGSSWDNSRITRILDAWAFQRSYRPLTLIGYEVKVSRSDFLNDNKWPEYLKYCNELYFVCPYGLIDIAELPENVGLIVTTKNGNKLYTKRKAVYREIDKTELFPLLIYVLMSRSKILSPKEMNSNRPSTIEYWKKWMKEKDENRRLGYAVSTKVQQHVTKVEDENRLLKTENDSLKNIKQRMIEAGHDPNVPVTEWNVRPILQKLLAEIPKRLPMDLRQYANVLNNAAERVEKHLSKK